MQKKGCKKRQGGYILYFHSKSNLDGNYLGDTWFEVLRCISQLETLQLIGSGVKQVQGQVKVTSESKSDLQNALAETSIQSVVVAVDKVFAESCKERNN